MMTALIIEDEPLAARRLEKHLREVSPDIEILEKLDGIDSTVEWWNTHDRPDVVFMDIHLSDGNCFEIFDQISLEIPIIFTTAYDEYALRSFEQWAVDYILKPIKKDDLVRALQRLTNYISQDQENDGVISAITGDLEESGLKRLLVKIGPRMNLIQIKNIAYFYSRDKITFAITREGRRFPLDKTLEYLENHLDRSFFRVNRQFIIHIDSINGMLSHTKGRVKVDLDPGYDGEIIVSTDRSPHFKKWLVS